MADVTQPAVNLVVAMNDLIDLANRRTDEDMEANLRFFTLS